MQDQATGPSGDDRIEQLADQVMAAGNSWDASVISLGDALSEGDHAAVGAVIAKRATAWRSQSCHIVVFIGRERPGYVRRVGPFSSAAAAEDWCGGQGLRLDPVDGLWAAVLPGPKTT